MFTAIAFQSEITFGSLAGGSAEAVPLVARNDGQHEEERDREAPKAAGDAMGLRDGLTSHSETPSRRADQLLLSGAPDPGNPDHDTTACPAPEALAADVVPSGQWNELKIVRDTIVGTRPGPTVVGLGPFERARTAGWFDPQSQPKI